MQDIQPRNELIKHSAAVHINNKLSLVERKVSNVLLKHAQNYMDKRDEHIISIKDLCEDLQIPDNKNYEMLKNALRALGQTQIEWNILNKDKKNNWGVTSIIASVEIENGICKYSYSTAIKKIFANPNIYAKLNMAIQASFTSKYSIALWEYIMEFLSSGSHQSVVQIKNKISVENMRKLLGVEDSKYYLEFSNFNREILKKAVKEINQLSDLEVELGYIKQNKKVEAIEIFVNRPNTSADKIGILSVDTSIPYTKMNAEKSQLLLTLFEEFGFSEIAAENLLSEFDTERIKLVLDYARKQNPLNPSAYIRKALKEQWQLVIKSAPSSKKDSETRESNLHYINSLEDGDLKKILLELQERFGDALFKAWFKDFKSIDYDNEGALIVTLNNYTSFKSDYLKDNYGHYIKDICKNYYKDISKIKFISD